MITHIKTSHQNSPNLIQNALGNLLILSQRGLGGYQFTIRQWMRYQQDLAFTKFSDPTVPQYIHFYLLNNPNIDQQKRQLAMQAINIRQDNIYQKIEEKNLVLGQRIRRPTSKFQLADFARDSILRLLSTKNTSIKQQVQLLSQSMKQIEQSRTSLKQKQDFQRNPQRQKQVKQFLSQIRLKKQQRRKKNLQNSIRVNQLKRLQEQQKKSKVRQKQQQKHNQLINMHNSNQKKRKQLAEERRIKNQQFKKYMALHKKKKPLHIDKQQKFLNQLQQQEKKKQALIQQMRKNSKPLNRQQLQQHMKQYDQQLKIRQQKRSQMRRIFQQSQSDQKDYFKSQRYQNSKSVQVHTKIQKEEKKKKIKQFQQQVKLCHKPKVSSQKRKQLMELVKDLHKKSIKVVNPNQGKNVGNNYLRELRYLPKKPRAVSSNDEYQQKTQKPDYLVQWRNSRKIRPNRSHDWKKDYQNPNLSKQQKFQRVMVSLQQLGTKCERQEQLLKIKPSKQGSIRLDNDYLQSINAKMALLKKISDQNQV